MSVLTQASLENAMEEAITDLLRSYRDVGVPTADVERILFDARKQRVKDGLNLIPSENLLSPKAKTLYWLATLAGLDGRYAEGNVGKRYYPGAQASDALETIAIDLAKELFGVSYADVRPISGNNANMALFLNYLEGGDVVMANTIFRGGHISASNVGALGKRIKVRGKSLKDQLIAIPVTEDGYHMDVVGTNALIEMHKPRLISTGKSLYLFPEPVDEISGIAKQVGAKIYKDGAHNLGLIAGGANPNPLDQGANVLGGSTHKTFYGPQGGILLTNDTELIPYLDKGVMPGTTSSHHLHRIVALIVALREFRQMGVAYAAQTVKNAQALAHSLDKYGVEPEAKLFGYTQTHQVAVDVRKITGQNGIEVEGWLQRSGIYANNNTLPFDKSVQDPSGIRMGTPEVTHKGMKEGEMDYIAWLISKVIKDRTDMSMEARNLARRFPSVQYAG